MKEENQKFQIENENGEVKEAEVLSIVELSGKKYCIYTIDNGDETVDVFASYVVVDDEGFDTLVDIDNPKDKEEVEKYIQNITN